MPEISQDAQAVLANATPQAVDYVTANTPGERLTSGEAQTLLQKFQAETGQVYSTENINQASTNPAVAPDDLLGIRQQIQTELGIPQLQQQYQEQFSGLQEFDTATLAQQNQIENQQIGLNVIRGAQAEATRLRSQERYGIASALAVTQSQLQAAQQEASAQFSIREADVRNRQALILQYPGAGITFGDSITSAASKIRKFEEKVQRDAYKKELQQLAISMGVSTKTKKGGTRDIKSLEKAIAKENKEALEEAKKMNELDMQIKMAQLNKTLGGSGGGTEYIDEVVIDTSTGDLVSTGNKVRVGTPTKFVDLGDTRDEEPLFTDEQTNDFKWYNPFSWF